MLPRKNYEKHFSISEICLKKSWEGPMNESNELRNREQDVVLNHPVDGETATLISADQVEHLRQQWTTVQSHFVDEPRKSVEEADHLVATAIKQIEDGF